MNFFKIQNVYSKKADDNSDSKFKFKIDFNISNIKLLKIHQFLKKLDLKKMQCDLMNATIVLQTAIIKQ